MTDAFIGTCWHCGQQLSLADYGREATCLGCSKDTRVCRNCRYFAPGRPNACVEPMADPVLNKARANFCGFFEPTTEPAEAAGTESQQALRQAAEALFRK